MYKTRNTGTGNGMWVTLGMGGNVIFWRMSPVIPGNILKHSMECFQTFRGISSNISRNVVKHSGECHQTFRKMSSNIPGNITKYSGELSLSHLNNESELCRLKYREVPIKIFYFGGECQFGSSLQFMFL